MHKNYINGEWLDGATASRNINPSNIADIVGEYAQADAAQAQLAIAAASEAALNWGLASVQMRCDALDKFTKTLARWQDSIAAFADGRVTNAVTEGLNNYLRYMQRISFGLSNFKNMRMRILVASA